MVGERSGQVSIIHLKEERPVKVLSLHRAPVFDIKTSVANQLIYVASEDGHVSVWSLVDFHLVYTFRVSDDTVRCISLSPDERQIAFGDRKSTSLNSSH